MADIFISREIEHCLWLQKKITLLQHSLTCKSCIETQLVDFELPPHYDWIFFSSSQGVQHFFSKNKILGQPKLAAMGKGTAKAISHYGKCEFIGKSTTPSTVAKDFKQHINKTDILLFPVGEKSLRSIPKALQSYKTKIVVVYDTFEKKIIIPEHHIYIFSSPSNFNSFIKNNIIPSTSKIISFGPSTSSAIKYHGLKINFEIPVATEKNILNAIISVLQSS